MTENHIHHAFDRELEALRGEVRAMGGRVVQAISEAAQALEDRDTNLAQALRARDKDIDALDDQINEEVAKLIARRQPAASDLRLVLSVVKVAASLERIGDYAKNMAKRTNVLVQIDPVGNAAGTLRRMAAVVEGMLEKVLTAYLSRDAAAAEEVRQADEEVDQIYSSLFRTLLTHMMEDPHCISAAMHLHFIAKNIERMGDHVTAIAEETTYLATGHRPDDDRPKGDKTSTTLIK